MTFWARPRLIPVVGINVFKLEDILASIESGTSDQATQVTPLHRVNTQGGRPQWVRLAARDRKVVVGLAGESGGGVWVWSLKDLASAKVRPFRHRKTISSSLSYQTAPLHVFREEALSTLELLPNPSITGALPNLVLALSEKGAVLLDIEKFEVAGRIDGEFTSGEHRASVPVARRSLNRVRDIAAWSARGKQVVLGRKDGSLEQYTPDGSLKATIPASSGAGQVNSLAWLENDAFLATFQDAEDEQDNKTYLVERSGAATLFDAILPPFGLDRPNGHRELAAVRGWGSTKRLGFLTSPASPDIAILRAGTATEDGWSVIIPDESARASVPLLEATGEGGGDNDDATCLGLEIDLTSTTPIKQTMSGGVEQPDLPPAPRLIEYTSDGIIIVYNIINTQDGAYAEMVQAGDILTAPEDAPEPTITPSVSSSSVASTPAPPAAASPFTAQASAKPTFGFGTGVKLPTVGGGFGQATGFGAKPAFGSSSSFGSSASQPAFGSSSSFGSSASAPAFGSSSFGTNGAQATSPSTAKPAFGSSAFGSSAVGSSSFGGSSSGHATPTASSSTPAFGSSAFGSSAFGASTTPAAPAVKGKGEEKKSGFGAFAPQGSSAFGSSAFGAGAKTASAFGNPASAGPSLFGSKPASKTFEGGSGSAFGLGGLEDMLGDDSKTTTNDKDSDTDDERGPVKESSASKPTSAFIQPSKAGSAFGAFAPNPTKSAFGSPSGSTTPSAFAGFGQTGKATTVPAFGSPSAFGQASAKSGSQPSTPTSAPAFGQTSAFGQPSSFGKSSPFGQTSAFGQAAASTTPAGKPSAGGFGSFASAIPSTSAFSGFASSTSVFGTSSADKPAAEPKKTEETPISLSADEASDAEGYELAGSQEGSDDEYYEEESAVGSQVAESEQAEYEDLSEPEDLGDVSDRSDLEKVEGGRSASEEPAADVGRTESAPAVESAKDAEHDAAATVEKPSAPAEPKTKDQDGSDDAKSSEAVAAQPSATKPLFSFGNQAPAQASKEPSTPLSFGGLSDAAEIGKQANSPSETPKDAPSPVAGPPASKAPESKAEVLAPETSQVDSKAQAKVDSSVTKPATALSTGFSFGGPAKAPSPGVTPGPFSFAKPADQAKEKSLGMSFGTASQAPTSTETKPADTSSTSKPFSFGATSKQPEPAAKPKATAPSTSQPFSFGAAPASSVSTPATAKPLFGFGFGSAATASNSTAQSTDPAKQADDETPVQPKPLFGFGASPVPTSPMPFTSATSDKPAPSAFSFGAPPATPSPKPTPPASTTPAGPPQPLFGQRPPSVKPVAAPEPPTPTPTPPPPQQAPRPSAAPSKPALPLGQLRMPSTIPARSSPLATGTSVVPSATASPPSTPAPTTQAPKREPAVLTTPTRRRTELAPEPPVQPGGLAAQAETLYRTMEARLKNVSYILTPKHSVD